MKKYELKKDFPSSKIGDVWVKEDNGFMSPEGRENIKMHEHLFKPFNDWFKDYEEPIKPYWYINDLDGKPMKCDLKNCGKSNFIKWGEHRKQIGNRFETEGECEKAAEKLKALQRLKDKGFEVDLWDYDGGNYRENIRTGRILFRIKDYGENDADLDSLFGGKE